MNTQEKLEFIFENREMISETNINNLYLDLMKSRISNDFSIYIDTRYLNHKLSYFENWKIIKTQILKHFASIEEYSFYQKFQYHISYINIDELDNKNTIQTRGLTVSSLIYILNYIVNNEIYDNSEIPNGITSKLGLKYNDVFDWTNFEFFGSVLVKKFKNEKISFRGLTPEMKKRIEYLYNLSRKRYLNIFD